LALHARFIPSSHKKFIADTNSHDSVGGPNTNYMKIVT
jgi:hypothetical protein